MIPDLVWGSVQFVIGGEIEINDGANLSTSRQELNDEGDWFVAFPGGMNLTDQFGRLRIATIVTRTPLYDDEVREVTQTNQTYTHLWIGPSSNSLVKMYCDGGGIVDRRQQIL
jgi:hypothetical protein